MPLSDSWEKASEYAYSENPQLHDHPHCKDGVLWVNRGRRSLLLVGFGVSIFLLGFGSCGILRAFSRAQGGWLDDAVIGQASVGTAAVAGIGIATTLWFYLNRNELVLDLTSKRFTRYKGLRVREGFFEEAECITIEKNPSGDSVQIIMKWDTPEDRFVLETHVNNIKVSEDSVLKFAKAYSEGLEIPLKDLRPR